MNTNNSSPNNFNNNFYESNLQTTVAQAYDMPVTHSNNVNDNNVTNFHQQYQQPNVTSLYHNHQQQYDDSGNISHHNYQQYIQQSDISDNDVTINPGHNHPNYQQPMSDVASNNNITVSSANNHDNNQQSTSLPPQFYHNHQNQHSSPQSDILPLLNPFGISIYYSQAPIIVMPTTNSDIQNQLQQVLAYLNQMKPQFQQ
ncbi:hypothetical protein RclHR1_00850020 [Rhizophagus clarus]|uniref:Uncharacterized protein n=1 Tax=Rhizophagus clarus TaxID=94130 RepID=A0A2Z6SNJ9_9GLOM|nr:hypothetical protein RclHR1_00850020 [Rhizophagus clarus]GES98094.1 hypothetical protein GLOIN_2v1880782 [Rhizophagus clarus]